MTNDQIQIFRQKLLDAIQAHLQTGGQIIDGSFGWYRQDNCRCPIGCMVSLQASEDFGFYDEIDRIVGFPVSASETESFIDGFDGGRIRDYTVPELYQLGQELRARFLPEEK